MLKRIVAIIIMCLFSWGIIESVKQYEQEIYAEQQKEIAKQEEQEVLPKKTFDIWYTFNGYEEYLKYVAEEFEKETGVKVNLLCKSDLEYSALINSESVAGNGPDLYIGSTTMLENMYLSGIVSSVDESIVNEDNYAYIAIDSVSYDNKLCGYPLGYEVSVLAYNTNYITEAPTTFEDIKSYVGYEEDEEGESTSIFEGIVNVFDMESDDLLYNYGFFSEYMDVSKDKETGKLEVSFTSDEAKNAAVQYVALKDYFGLGNDTKEYATIVDDFIAGKTLFAILNTGIVGNESFAALNYDIVSVPDFSSTVQVTPMSYTEMIIVNPYSDSIEEAKKFAQMASYDLADVMFEKCGILSAKKNIEYADEIATKFYGAYEESVSLPKYMETEDYALLVKNTINYIWKGENVTTVLEELQNIYIEKNN